MKQACADRPNVWGNDVDIIEFAKPSRINCKETPFAKMNRRQLCRRPRAALGWIAVAVLTATWAWEVQGLPAEPRRLESTALGQYVPLARGFDLGEMANESALQIVQPSWANGEGLQLAQETTGNAEELRQALKEEQHKTQALSRDLTIAQRDVEFMMLLLNQAREQWARIVEAAEAETAKLQNLLRQERERTQRLEREPGTARQDLAAEREMAEPRNQLQQESDRASRLEQDLVAARRDVETQTALATKSGAEASQLKKTADADAAELRKLLQQERDRASRLEQDLVAARRDVETQTGLVAKAGAEASQLKKTADADAAELRKSLQQERDRASRLDQDLVVARRDVKTQTALVAKAGAEASQLKKTAEKGAAELKQALQQEQDKAATLAQELTTARARITAHEVQARRADDQAEELKQAESGTAELQKSLRQESDRASRLEQDLATARRDVEAQTALATKASAEASQLKQVADSDTAELKRSLQKEHDRAEALAQDLSMVHTAINAYEAQAREAKERFDALRR